MNQFSQTLEQLAHLVQGELVGQPDVLVFGLSSLEHANENQISFVNGEKYLSQASASQAGTLIVTPVLKDQLPLNKNYIVVQNPYLAFATLTHVFERKKINTGIEATAQIHPSAILGENVYIGHYVVIGENAVIGENTRIEAHVTIDDGVELGHDCFIDSHVTITGFSHIGNFVRIHANSVIGSEGFGFAPYEGKWHRIAQIGSVIIKDHVRIGSNCSIDRGALDSTILHEGVIIDNLVQIAHNVHIGKNTAIAAKTGIAGSTKIGENCILAGACGIAGHIEITDNVTLTGMSMVTKSILKEGTYSSGTGLFDTIHWRKTVVRLRQLADVPLTQMLKRLDHMQTQIESTEINQKPRK